MARGGRGLGVSALMMINLPIARVCRQRALGKDTRALKPRAAINTWFLETLV